MNRTPQPACPPVPGSPFPVPFPGFFLLLILGLAGPLAQAAPGDRVVVIVCDGLRPDAITAETAPRLAELRARSAVAPEALCDLPTGTLPNHVSLLTGLEAHRHGILLNFELPGRVPHPTVFEHAATAGLRAGFYAGKDKLAFVAREESLIRSRIHPEPRVLLDLLLGDLPADDPDLLFLHLREPDSTGHAQDWMSPAYFEAVAEIDLLIGELLDALQRDPRPTWVLVTADHGGFGPNHVFNTPTVRRIPWFVAGPDVVPGPMAEAVVTTDTMPTVLLLLGLDVPEGIDGRPRGDVLSGRAAPPTNAPIGPPCLVLPLALIVLSLAVSGAGCHNNR